MNKYSEITTTDELDKAIHRITADRNKYGKALRKDIREYRDRYKPVTMALGAVRRFTPYFTWAELGLGLVRSLRKCVAGKKK
jgi:hypothetical protein